MNCVKVAGDSGEPRAYREGVRPLNVLRALVVVLVMLVMAGPTGTAVAADTSVYDLGGPCLGNDESGADLDDSVSLYREVTRAAANRDWARAIELQKRMVRRMCDNAFRWFRLAEFHRQAGEDTAAINVVTYLYQHHPNTVEERLARDDGLLLDLRRSPSFQGSKLQAMMKRNRQSLRKRRRRFRETLASLSDGQKPPEHYVARDVCPFECCVYRSWSIHGSVTVYDQPRGDTIIARVDEGDTVRGLTGNVYLKPRPVGVREPMTLDRGRRSSRSIRAEPGDVLFLLDYVGEGYSHAWYRGDTYTVSSHTFQNHCPRPNDRCRGEYLFPDGDEYDQDWWVKIRLNDGTVGWTNEVEPFGNLDACS